MKNLLMPFGGALSLVLLLAACGPNGLEQYNDADKLIADHSLELEECRDSVCALKGGDDGLIDSLNGEGYLIEDGGDVEGNVPEPNSSKSDCTTAGGQYRRTTKVMINLLIFQINKVEEYCCQGTVCTDCRKATQCVPPSS